MNTKKLLCLTSLAIALLILLRLVLFKGTTKKLIATCAPDAVCDGQDTVILHGLARSSNSMKKIARALNNHGYTVCNIQYPSRKYAIKEIAVNFVAPEIKKCFPDSDRSVNFVTHSMGGIIVRQLAQATDIKINRVVMLSPPNHGSELTDKLKVIPGFKLINGEAGLSLGTEINSVPNTLGKVNFATKIITGDRSYNPVYSYLIRGADDGKVSVESAKIEGMEDFLVVPYSHSFIMNSDVVIGHTIDFLKSQSN